MPFETLRTVSFRNLMDNEVTFSGKDIFLVGENGQGKTNFLEALYFCSYAASFRGVRDGEVSRTGEKSFSAAVKLSGSLYDHVLVKFENGKKVILLDGKPAEDRKELLEISPCIVFCHEDMEFVSGTPERRRWFFDQSLSLYDPVYLDDLRRYRKILKTRNTVLKENQGFTYSGAGFAGSSLLDVLDPQLAAYGIRLMEKREEAARLFSETFGPLYEVVTGIGGIEVKYIPSWKKTGNESLTAFLGDRREADLSAGICLSGPHRDRYSFTRFGMDFSHKASTGQRRLLALLLRIAQARRFSNMTGRNPVLLLDDVLLELDPEKRRRLLSVMPGYDQAFYTFLPEEPYNRYQKSDTLVYFVHGGHITQTAAWGVT